MARRIDWGKTGRAIILGAIFYLVALILGADANYSAVIGLLVAYLEYRINKL